MVPLVTYWLQRADIEAALHPFTWESGYGSKGWFSLPWVPFRALSVAYETMTSNCFPLKRVMFSHTRYRALGPELIPVYRQSARRWLEVIHTVVGCHYFPLQAWGYLSRRASPPIGRHQIILLGDRGTCVWAACPRLLHWSGPAEIRTCDLLDREQTLYC